jgi:hypothetical protein
MYSENLLHTSEVMLAPLLARGRIVVFFDMIMRLAMLMGFKLKSRRKLKGNTNIEHRHDAKVQA